MPTPTHRTDADRSTEVDTIVDAGSLRARSGKTPQVITPAEHERRDHAQRLQGIADTQAVVDAGSGSGKMRQD